MPPEMDEGQDTVKTKPDPSAIAGASRIILECHLWGRLGAAKERRILSEEPTHNGVSSTGRKRRGCTRCLRGADRRNAVRQKPSDSAGRRDPGRFGQHRAGLRRKHARPREGRQHLSRQRHRHSPRHPQGPRSDPADRRRRPAGSRGRGVEPGRDGAPGRRHRGEVGRASRDPLQPDRRARRGRRGRPPGPHPQPGRYREAAFFGSRGEAECGSDRKTGRPAQRLRHRHSQSPRPARPAGDGVGGAGQELRIEDPIAPRRSGGRCQEPDLALEARCRKRIDPSRHGRRPGCRQGARRPARGDRSRPRGRGGSRRRGGFDGGTRPAGDRIRGVGHRWRRRVAGHCDRADLPVPAGQDRRRDHGQGSGGRDLQASARSGERQARVERPVRRGLEEGRSGQGGDFPGARGVSRGSGDGRRGARPHRQGTQRRLGMATNLRGPRRHAGGDEGRGSVEPGRRPARRRPAGASPVWQTASRTNRVCPTSR